MEKTRRALRLFAVMAILVGVLVPAVAASATDEVRYECGDSVFDNSNPDHILYGRSVATPVVDGKMIVDLTGMSPAGGEGFTVYWDGHFSFGSAGLADGAIITGSDYKDVICGTEGDDQIKGKKGNDRIYGNGAYTHFDNRTYDAATCETPTPAASGGVQCQLLDGDSIWGNKGNDYLTNGDGLGVADAEWEAAFLAGGIGNDNIIVGRSWGGTPYAKGGPGNDGLYGGTSGDDALFEGNDGDDYFSAFGVQEAVFIGNLGNDFFDGGWDRDNRFYGGGGDDTFVAGSGSENGFFGGPGADKFYNMGDGTDQVADGGPDDDYIEGAQSSDNPLFAFGGAGNDVIVGTSDEDCLWGDYATTIAELDGIQSGSSNGGGCADGSDWAGIDNVPDGYFGGVGPAQVSGNDTIWGMDDNDEIHGGPGDDHLYGNFPQTLHPNQGLDAFDGYDDALFGDDGNDDLFGGYESGVCESDGAPGGAPFNNDGDWADGGGNFVAGDNSHGFWVNNVDLSIEHQFDTCA